jgi:hypothetical protein
VHQSDTTSSDIVLALQLDAQVQQVDTSAERALAIQRDVRITELMYNPLGGSAYEFVEIQNTGTLQLDLAGVRLAGGIEFAFPSLQLGPGEFAVVVADEATFRQRYGNLALVAGKFEQSLNNGGEEIRLVLPEPYETNILSFEYSDDWYAATDGSGFSLVIDDPLASRGAWTEARNWRASNFINGSPGFVDSGLDVGILKINEVLAHTNGVAGDQVEILNTTESALDISGWYLSNDAANLTKYRLPEGTTLPPGQFAVFTATDHFGAQFALDDYGGEVILASPDAVGAAAGFVVSQSYGAADQNVSLGRYLRSDGGEDFVIQSAASFGAPNNVPSVDTVVISEIMYSSTGGDEFIELHNRGSSSASLFSAVAPDRTWSLNGAVDFRLPTGLQLSPGAYLLIVGGEPDAFRLAHDIPDEIVVLGPYTGTLDDAHDEIRLSRPATGQPSIDLLVDRVNYSAVPPWPSEAGSGPSSLIRVPLDAYGNDPISWAPGIAGGTPGTSNRSVDTTPPSAPTNLGWQLAAGPAVNLNWSASIDAETNVTAYRVFRDQQLISTSTSTNFADSDVAAPGAYVYQISAVNAQGLESDLSSPLDVHIMSIDSVISRFANQIVIRFSEPVVAAEAVAIENYRIDGVQVLDAQLATDGRTVSLTTSDMQLNSLYQLSVDKIVGAAGTPFPPGMQFPFSYQEGITGFTVLGVQTQRTTLRSLADMDALLAQPAGSDQIARQLADIYPTINFSDDDDHVSMGEFPNDVPFPTDVPGAENNFLIRASGYLKVQAEQAGTWTFGANLDAPQTVEVDKTVLPAGATWRYSDRGIDLGTQWREPDFDDAGWAVGSGQFGYGDGDELTRLDFGPDASHKVTTYYFRTSLDIEDPSKIVGARAWLTRDDGAAVYLNGVEITRQNLLPNATFDDFARLPNEPPFETAAYTFQFDPSIVREGENILAVEVHQSGPADEDLSFDLEVELRVRESSSTDGFRLMIDSNPVITADVPNSASDRLGSVQLAAGAHTIDVEFFDATEGAEVELFAAPGQFSNYGSTDTWRLVGDRTGGGLSVTTDALPPEPLVWSSAPPDGGFVARADANGALKGLDIPVGFAADLRLGELLSALVQPEAANATLTVRLRDSLQTLQTWTASAPGAPVVVPGIPATLNDTYVLEVSSDRATDFQIMALANAMSEAEMASAADHNNTAAAAQDISSSWVSVLEVLRAAVSGRTDDDGAADFYALELGQADVVSVASAWELAGPSRLELYSANLTLLAVGIDRSTANSISDFPIQADGTYYVRVHRDEVSNYNLVVTRGAGIDALPNETLDTATPLSITKSVVGALGVEFPGTPGGATQTTAMPLLLTDGEGFQWNIQPEGYIGAGSSGAYDFGEYLPGATGFLEGTVEQNGREVVLGPSPLGANLTLTRKIFVSPDHGFARYLEIFTNNGNTPATQNFQLYSNLGSDNGTQLVATSGGEDLFSTSDDWLITDDADGRNDPTLLHLLSGSGGLRPTTASLVTDELTFSFELMLEPGETQVVMHFAAQNADRQAARQKASALSELAGGALVGMSLDEIAQVVNFDVADILDSYAIHLNAGQEVTLTTSTPTEDSVRAGAVIDPALTLFDSTGAQLANDDNGAVDGRNARLVWTAPTDGRYVVQVASLQGAGAYRLTSSVVNLPPLSVVGTEPMIGQPVPRLPNSWVLDFSSPVDITSVNAGDLLINDQPAIAVEFVDADSLRFTADALQVEGVETITLRIAERTVSNYSGTGNQAFESSYIVDSTAPRVAATSWNGEPFPATRLVASGLMQIGITFDEPIRSANLDPSDVRVLISETQQVIAAQAVGYDDSRRSLVASFFLTEGDYSLVLSSADGAFEDVAGNHLDGDSVNGSLPSGDGHAGGDYRVAFRVDQQTIDMEPRMLELKPAGSRAGQVVWSDRIAYAEDVDTYELMLASGERLGVHVALAELNPASGMTVEVRDPWGRIVGHNRVDASGMLPAIDDLTAVTDGVYQIRIADGSVGESYTMTLLKNAVAEFPESSPRNPIAMDDSLVDGPVRRFAARGSSQPLDASEFVWGVQPGTGQIVIVSPSSGDVAFRFAAPGNLLPSHVRIGLTMADVGQTLLYVNADDDATRLYRLDPWSGEVLGIQTLESSAYDGLTFEAGKLFLGRREVDVARQTVTGDPAIAGWSTGVAIGGLAGDDYGRAFGVFGDRMIHEFDPASDADGYMSSMPVPATDIEGLAFDGALLYAASASGVLFTIAPDVEGTPVLRDVTVEGGALFGLAALSEQGGTSSSNGQVTEQEPNNSLAAAQNLDGLFGLDTDANIGDSTGNTSTSIPHVTVRGQGTGNFDFYSFSVNTAGTRGIFDIDASSGNLDAYLRLYGPNGNIVAENDDALTDAGSSSGVDSFMEFTFPTTGTYTIEVASCCVGTVPSGSRYNLHVSLESATFPRSKDVELIAAGANWKYWDQGTLPSPNWPEPGIDDGPWPEARAQLGYGDGDEQGVVSFGADENNKPITTYFRKTIEIADPASYAELWVDLLRDDAALVYVNGQMVIADNLPATFDDNTPAIDRVDGADENVFQSFPIDPGLLQPGRNVIAVEVHQHSATDPDLSFDLRLRGTVDGIVISLPSAVERDAYTLDLSGSSGRRLDFVLAGQQGVRFTQGSSLRLLDPSGQTVLAEAVADLGAVASTNYDLAIRDFVVPADGIYRLLFESEVAGSYSILAVDGAAFDTEPNRHDTVTLRQIHDGQNAFGIVALANASSIVDPRGDTLAGSSATDIASMDAHVEGNMLIVSIDFYDSILPTTPNGNDGTFIYVELDVDQDPATGTPALQNQAYMPGQLGGPLGVEFVLNASTNLGNQALLFNPLTGQVAASLPLTVTDTSFRVEIPLADLGQDDGLVNLGMLSGRLDVSDAAPNDAFLSSQLGDGTDGAEADVYEVALQQGQRQRLTIDTLPGIDGRTKDGIYSLSVFDAAGNLLISDVDLPTDGRNADLVFTAPASGIYRAVIEIAEGSARYVLSRQALMGPTVLGRHLFYNHSSRDGNDVAANAADDAAIAHDKLPLRPGGPVRFENYSSFVHGINGVMIDLIDAPSQPSLDDFQFRVGNDDRPNAWTDAPRPREILVRPGAGIAGSDRITLVWDDGVIANQWLQITVRATAATGLTEPDVFYFGNLVGETGDSPDVITVSSIDIVGVNHYVGSIVASVRYLERLDFNRDGRVDAQDGSVAFQASRDVLRPVFGVEPGPADALFESGDANFDNNFDEEDLLLVMQLGEFEDLFAGNSIWSEGDWDGDGDFTTSDLVFAFQQGFLE